MVVSTLKPRDVRWRSEGESALNRLPLTDLASDAPLGVGGAVCAVGAPTGKSGRPFEQSRPAFGLGGASEREREDLHPSMRTCAVKPVGLAAGLRLCLESWRGSSDRRLLCVPAGASPRALRSASFASRARCKGASPSNDYLLDVRTIHTSSTPLNPQPPATTLKAVTPSAGESTAVNGRDGIAQGVNVEKSVGFSTIENFNQSVAKSVDCATGSGRSLDPSWGSQDRQLIN